MEEILRKVKEAEQKAEAMVNEAKMAAGQTVNEARVQAGRLIEQSIKEARDEAERLKSERRKAVEAKLAQMTTNGANERSQIIANAKTHFPAAVSLIKERMVKHDGRY